VCAMRGMLPVTIAIVEQAVKTDWVSRRRSISSRCSIENYFLPDLTPGYKISNTAARGGGRATYRSANGETALVWIETAASGNGWGKMRRSGPIRPISI